MKFLRLDNGGEYTFVEFKAYLAGEGFKHQLSISGRAEQNRVAECMNQTLTKHDRSMRLQADKSKKNFGHKQASHAFYLANKSPSTAFDLQTLEEI